MDYAGFWIRVAAFLIDTVILNVVQTVILMLFGLGFAPLDAAADDDAALGLFGFVHIVILVLNVLYFAVMESSSKQATLGKMILGLTVVDRTGRRIGFLRALARFFAKFVSAIVLFAGFVMVAFTERKQGLHDVMCGTLVVKARPDEAFVDASVFA